MRIVFFGDSLTQGAYGANYVNRVAALLRGHHFFNEGVNGDTSLNLYRRVDADVIAKAPDGVFIMIGINDAISYSIPAKRLYYRLNKRVAGGQISPIAFRENLRAVITRLLAQNIVVWVALPPVEYSPAVVDTLRQMNDYAAQVCRGLNVPVLDLMARLTPMEIPDRPPARPLDIPRNLLRLLLPVKDYAGWSKEGGYTYSFDGLHLTEDGAQAIAEAVAQFLRENGVEG